MTWVKSTVTSSHYSVPHVCWSNWIPGKRRLSSGCQRRCLDHPIYVYLFVKGRELFSYIPLLPGGFPEEMGCLNLWVLPFHGDKNIKYGTMYLSKSLNVCYKKCFYSDQSLLWKEIFQRHYNKMAAENLPDHLCFSKNKIRWNLHPPGKQRPYGQKR